MGYSSKLKRELTKLKYFHMKCDGNVKFYTFTKFQVVMARGVVEALG